MSLSWPSPNHDIAVSFPIFQSKSEPVIRVLLFSAPQGYITGNGPEKSRRIRMIILRYMNLAWIILMRRISDQIAIRFRLNTMKEKDEEEAAGRVETNVRDIFRNINADKSELIYCKRSFKYEHALKKIM